jgi:predicted metal-dependent phosphoesterase TrpH
MKVRSLRVDFHCHTLYSPDSIAKVGDLLKGAHLHGLDRLVITDHNSIRGALEAFNQEQEFVIVGEEIKTTYGEFLAAFVKEEIPAHLDPFKAIEELRSQDAFISVSHPMDPYRSGWPLGLLEEIAPLVDAIEIGNARVLTQAMNVKAARFAHEHGLAGTAGSDGHDPYEVGRMALDVPDFYDAESLKKVIFEGKVIGRISPAWVHLFSVRAKRIKIWQGRN